MLLHDLSVSVFMYGQATESRWVINNVLFIKKTLILYKVLDDINNIMSKSLYSFNMILFETLVNYQIINIIE